MNPNRSATKAMLTTYWPTIAASAARPFKHHVLKTVYDSVKTDCDFDEYESNAVFWWSDKRLYLVIRRFENVGWIDMTVKGKAPVSLRTYRKLLAAVAYMINVDYVSAKIDSTNPRYCEWICRKLGMEKLADDLYSIGVTV